MDEEKEEKFGREEKVYHLSKFYLKISSFLLASFPS